MNESVDMGMDWMGLDETRRSDGYYVSYRIAFLNIRVLFPASATVVSRGTCDLLYSKYYNGK